MIFDFRIDPPGGHRGQKKGLIDPKNGIFGSEVVPGLLRMILGHFFYQRNELDICSPEYFQFFDFWTHPQGGGSPGSNLGLVNLQNGASYNKIVPDLLKITLDTNLSTLRLR